MYTRIICLWNLQKLQSLKISWKIRKVFLNCIIFSILKIQKNNITGNWQVSSLNKVSLEIQNSQFRAQTLTHTKNGTEARTSTASYWLWVNKVAGNFVSTAASTGNFIISSSSTAAKFCRGIDKINQAPFLDRKKIQCGSWCWPELFIGSLMNAIRALCKMVFFRQY